MYDVAIIGAGPVGLAFALSLAGQGLSIVLVERQPEAALADPAFDGREIALTHHSRAVMEQLGAWDALPADAVSPLRRAQVLNGHAAHALTFTPPAGAGQPLGFLVANHLIRGALYSRLKAWPEITLLASTALGRLAIDAGKACLHLADGQQISARLAVAADTRFSEARKGQGIGAAVHDFHRTMMVCRMAHEAPHHQTATEWFDYGQTAALLPVNGGLSSVVITRGAAEIARLKDLPPTEFEAEMQQSLARRRLGELRLVSTRHAYPLVATYAHRFTARRFALIGDAAVGMHPVTAHGFNLGLSGAARLAGEILGAQSAGQDIAGFEPLRRYETAHRRASFPLFAATNAIAVLYSKEVLPARLARHAILRLGAALPPARQAISALLTDRRETALAPSPAIR